MNAFIKKLFLQIKIVFYANNNIICISVISDKNLFNQPELYL